VVEFCLTISEGGIQKKKERYNPFNTVNTMIIYVATEFALSACLSARNDLN